MSNPWFRLYSEFATDPKMQMMSEADQRRFIMLLCLKCCNGDVTLHDTEVAFQLRISNEEWAQSKALFLQKGIIEDDNTPSAWDKRQFVSDSSAERVRRHREKRKQDAETPCNVTVTPPDTDSDTDTDSEESTTMPVSAKRAKRATQLPEDFTPNDIAHALAAELRVSIPAELPKFIDRNISKAAKYSDWQAAFRTWLRNAKAFGRTTGPPGTGYLNGRDAGRLAASRSIFGTDIEGRNDDRTIDASIAGQLGSTDLR